MTNNVRERLTTLDAKIQMLQEKRARYVEAAQDRCKHLSVVEGAYRPQGIVVDTLPPFRVCVECGFAEDGWRFQVLSGYFPINENGRRVVEASRDEARKLVTGRILNLDGIESYMARIAARK